jgi:hypothetical protein
VVVLRLEDYLTIFAHFWLNRACLLFFENLFCGKFFKLTQIYDTVIQLGGGGADPPPLMGTHVRYTGVLLLMLKVKIAVSKEWFASQ